MVVKRYLSISLMILRRLLGLFKYFLRKTLTKSVRWWSKSHSLRPEVHTCHMVWGHHSNGCETLRPMNHAGSYSLLLLKVCLFFSSSSKLHHLLEIYEAAESVSMCLSLHNGHGFSIMCSFSVNWAAAYHHLLNLLAFTALKILLVIHLLKLLEAEMLLLLHFIHLRRIVFGWMSRRLFALWVGFLWRWLDR